MSDIDWELLFRYLGQECAREDQARVDQWLAADPQHRTILESATVAAGRVLEATPVRASGSRLIIARSTPHRSPWAVAAAASLVIALGGTLIWRALEPTTAGIGRAGAMRTTTTGRGERDTLRLDDGTRVVLGAASTLRYPAAFDAHARDVYLIGEGYFQVSHDSRRPFRVHAGNATAEDLGTAFDVRAYAEDSVVGVVVAEGKVALGAATTGSVQGAILIPGQLGRLRRGTTIPSVQHVDVATYLGWTRGQVAFDDTPLGEVVVELARWYHAEFRIADASLATRRLTGSFTNQSLPDMLATLAPVLGVRFERMGDTVIVHRTARSP